MISLLAQAPDTDHAVSVNYPNYMRNIDEIVNSPPRWPEHMWNKQDRLFEPTPAALLTNELRQRSLLAHKKGYVLSEIVRGISDARAQVMTGVVLQETVYLTKKSEAQRYKDAGYPLLVPTYVRQYADLSGLTPREAADEILFKAHLSDEYLLQSEFFRLKYFNLVKRVTEVALVDQILLEFWREFYWLA
jgi:hypothetical protein